LRIAVNHCFVLRIGLVLFLCITGATPTFADDEKARIEYREQVTAFFSEAKATLTFEISAKEEVAGKAQWLLLAKGRVLASGAAELTPSPDKPALLTIERTLPPLEEGVAFALQMKVSFVETDAKKPSAELIQDLWLLSENPFVNRIKALEALEIQLFDPTGDTVAALEKLEVPFERLNQADAISELSRGTLVIGEGISLKDYPSLPKSFCEVAARGVNVICLAPVDGEIALPLQASDDDAQPAQVALRRVDVIHELDKRLTARWIGDESPVRSELRLASAGEKIKGHIEEPGSGWSWVEVRYDKPGARAVLCGLGLIRDWDRSPAPRYLLARLLEQTSAPFPVKTLKD
jgi:hypothetical protein